MEGPESGDKFITHELPEQLGLPREHIAIGIKGAYGTAKGASAKHVQV